jgi:hypothetical protein
MARTISILLCTLALAAFTLCTVHTGRPLADVVTDWNMVALNATALPPNSALQSRTLAIVHAAIYDATRSVERKSAPYAVDIEAPAGTSVEAAIVAAAHGVLVRLAAAQRPMLDAALDASLSKIADGKAKLDGVALGGQIAEKVVALRADDGAAAKVAFVPKPGSNLYQLTPPQMLPAVLPQWGAITPFMLSSKAGLDFKGAPEMTTAEFAREFEEIKAVGGRHSTTRTADQTAAAIFWTVLTAVPWHAAARAASEARACRSRKTPACSPYLRWRPRIRRSSRSRRSTSTRTGGQSPPFAPRPRPTSEGSRGMPVGSRLW